jgi:hypothetical protein
VKKPFAILSGCLLVAAGAFLLVQPDSPVDPSPTTSAFVNLSPELVDRFEGRQAHDHVEALVQFGPRPPESEGLSSALDYLETQLQESGWSCRRQTFRAATPQGPVSFTNLIARHGTFGAPEKSPVWLIGGHIDTKKLPFRFVGANDGGSSTGVLLELARVLATDPDSAAQVELVFFDGEEALGENIVLKSGHYRGRDGRTEFRRVDGLYGSKFFARSLASRHTLPAGAIILDIVGDPEHDLLFSDAPESFLTAIRQAAARRSFTQPVRPSGMAIVDDHVPLQQAGIPCLHLIGDFGAMDYWHEAGDTLDRVDPQMLEEVGRMTLDFLAQVRPPQD